TIISSTVYASVNGQIAVQQSTTSTATTNTSSCTISSPPGAAEAPQNTDQTIALGASIVDISGVYISNCGDALFASASGLPSGVTMTFSNNVGQTNGVNYSAISALIAGTPSSQTTGTYNYTVTVNDTSSNTFTYGGTITVINTSTSSSTADTTPPVITLTGSSTINLTLGDTFTDPGATASDNVDGNITSSINSIVIDIDGSNIALSGTPYCCSFSTAVPGPFASVVERGTFTISYNVSDAAGNAATVVQRTVIVSAATSTSSACTPILRGPFGQLSQSVTVGQAITDIVYEIRGSCPQVVVTAFNLPPGVSISDPFERGQDGYLNLFNIDYVTGTPTLSGTYNYEIVLAEHIGGGSSSTTNTISFSGTITVLSATSTSTTSSSTADTTAPVITLVGENNTTLYVGPDSPMLPDPGATASDNVDGDLTSAITISGTDTLQTALNGTGLDAYEPTTVIITYSVTDTAGNSASLQRTVLVKFRYPTITLVGSSTINLNVGDTWTDPGATAEDPVQGVAPFANGTDIQIIGQVDTSAPGTYIIRYQISNTAANPVFINRTVIVSATTTA
ncbi:MAG: immunoglobulin-like domain-containing protein, partial [Methylophagaceae bacterium]